MCRVQMLDAVRYMVVWNPIILTGLHFVLLAFGVKPGEHHGHHGMGGINGTLVLNNGTMAFNGTGMMFPGPGANVTTA